MRFRNKLFFFFCSFLYEYHYRKLLVAFTTSLIFPKSCTKELKNEHSNINQINYSLNLRPSNIYVPPIHHYMERKLLQKKYIYKWYDLLSIDLSLWWYATQKNVGRFSLNTEAYNLFRNKMTNPNKFGVNPIDWF